MSNNDDTIAGNGDETLDGNNDDVVHDSPEKQLLDSMSALEIIAYVATRPDIAKMRELTATRQTIENTMTELHGTVSVTLAKIDGLCGSVFTHPYDIAAFDAMIIGMMSGQRLGDQMGPTLDDINTIAADWVAARQPQDTPGGNGDTLDGGNGDTVGGV